MQETRKATAADATLLTRHRKAMFADAGESPEAALDEMSRHFEPWVARMIAAGKYSGWITYSDDFAVASAGLLVLDWAPHFLDPAGEQRGYLLNVFVEPEYRRRGLARALVETCVAEARSLGIRVIVLHATNAGRGLYEGLGFRASNEMRYVAPVETERRPPSA
jgi:ribosomal protein S18 acetylase RimI-like enzyme